METPDSHHVVAHLDGEPVGMVGGVPTATPDAVGLISLWVGPGARRRGRSPGASGPRSRRRRWRSSAWSRWGAGRTRRGGRY
ncbi:GNAT family N-acetyltransferase [Streptomyces sp. NPDC049906]|uniref:GNAT family N-acetyltransferase n=1 Tax=Streptomyces sp. NPDC049906 TaxID=3155656 RepID=UPI0034314A1E